MKGLHNFLYKAVFAIMLFIMAAAVFKFGFNAAREEDEVSGLEEIMARNADTRQRVTQMEAELEDMAGDIESIQLFIDEISAAAAEARLRKETSSGGQPGNYSVSQNAASAYGAVSGSELISGNRFVSGNELVSGNYFVSGNELIPESGFVSGNRLKNKFFTNEQVRFANIVPAAQISQAEIKAWLLVSGNELIPESASVSGNSLVSGNYFISGNELISGNGSVSDNDYVSGNVLDETMLTGTVNTDVSGASLKYTEPELTLEERRAKKTSYEETLEADEADRKLITENKYDFSGLKIACLGDSLTAASNLENEENYEGYSYPYILKELLGAGEVINLGVGGSSIGRYWSAPYVERYKELPADTDIIIVLGGTNDGFCVSENEFGSLDGRAPYTFCGDLDELMRGLKENYPSAALFFVTPPPNILQDYLMAERDYLLPQKDFADAILTIAAEYGIAVIDLYNSNILDTHDANVVADFMPDGVHGNHEGYRILAQHIAAGLVEYFN